jgi:RHS repeat-associated protein
MISIRYNDANELTSATTGGVTTAYTYDGWGRTISKTDGTHDATYTWRFGDKLRVYTSDFPGEADVAYNYDGLGKRRNRLNNPNGAYTDADLTWYRWDAAWNLIGEYESDDYTVWDVGDMEKHYTFTPGSKGTQLSHVDGSAPASGAYNYYAHDHLGSPRGVYSQAQAVVATQEFTPYGSHYATTGPAQTVGFTGHIWDASTQAFYAPYRYYSPGTARWLSRDPLGILDGPNVYGYVMGNPVQLVDLLGGSCGDDEDYDCIEECHKNLQKCLRKVAILVFLCGLACKGFLPTLPLVWALCAVTCTVAAHAAKEECHKQFRTCVAHYRESGKPK